MALAIVLRHEFVEPGGVQVRTQRDGAFLVGGVDDAVEGFGGLGCDGEQADVVDDDDVGAHDALIARPVVSSARPRSDDAAEVFEAEPADVGAVVDRSMSEGFEEVALAGAGWAARRRCSRDVRATRVSAALVGWVRDRRDRFVPGVEGLPVGTRRPCERVGSMTLGVRRAPASSAQRPPRDPAFAPWRWRGSGAVLTHVRQAQLMRQVTTSSTGDAAAFIGTSEASHAPCPVGASARRRRFAARQCGARPGSRQGHRQRSGRRSPACSERPVHLELTVQAGRARRLRPSSPSHDCVPAEAASTSHSRAPSPSAKTGLGCAGRVGFAGQRSGRSRRVGVSSIIGCPGVERWCRATSTGPDNAAMGDDDLVAVDTHPHRFISQRVRDRIEHSAEADRRRPRHLAGLTEHRRVGNLG